MSLYLCKEEMTENGGYLVPIRELIQCKECIHFKYDADCFGDCMLDGGIVRTIYSNDFCSWAVRSEDETS